MESDDLNGIPFSAVVRRQKACATDDKPTRLMTSGFDRPESTTALAAATLVPQSYDLLRPMSSRPSRPTERNVCSHCHTELGKTPSLRATALRPSPPLEHVGGSGPDARTVCAHR